MFLTGCGPKYTYPAQTVPKAIEDICFKENKIEVQARVVGKTVGAIVYVDGAVDAKGQASKEVNEILGKVMMAVSRVALSTDLPLDYCSIVLRDRTQKIDFTVIRSIDDTRRANAEVIGFEETNNRIVFEQPVKSSDPFVLKEVKIEDFLSNQILQRVRFNFSKETKGAKDTVAQPMVLVEGIFDSKEGRRAFHFSVISLKSYPPQELMLTIFKTASTVLRAYKFMDYDTLEINDYLNRQKLVVDRETVLTYQNKKITDKELLERTLYESASLQEAFKLFGFAVSSENQEKESVLNNSPAR